MWMLLSIVFEKIKKQSKPSDFCLSPKIMKHLIMVMKSFKVEPGPDVRPWHIQPDLITPKLLASLSICLNNKKYPLISVSKLIITCATLLGTLKICAVLKESSIFISTSISHNHSSSSLSYSSDSFIWSPVTFIFLCWQGFP